MKRSDIYTTLEMSCVFCWLVLDGFWLMDWKWAAYVFSALSIGFAACMFWFMEQDLVLIACADTCWLSCNIFWCIGDMDHNKSMILISKWWFGASLIFCCLALYNSRRCRDVLVLSRMRIMKWFSRT